MATLFDLIAGAEDAPALVAPERATLSHAGLRAQIERTARSLNEAGIGRGDRVAIVLPNGPDMAAAFLSVARAATAAPLNPAYTREEAAFYLTDLGVAAIVLAAGEASPAREAAEAAGIAILDLMPAEAAGAYALSPRPAGTAARPGPTEAADIALVLHTSGTTSRPKIVPLSHANLVASAGHIAASLALSPADTCLNIMPLFHIHGLVAAVLASLSAGGSVVCTPGFHAFRFFHLLAEARPSWVTAVPTMYQALLPYAERHGDVLAAGRLRLLRSSSASLPAPVMTALEAAFGVPVIESYGMTEAAHQMASNPLPPAARFPGSVGRAAGPQVAILGESGLQPPGALGEVVICGPNVTAGYENNPAANAEAFRDGWFRTGDQGYFDEDGYLRLTGRLKELINRGGEKVSPLEVDGVLLQHAAVAQCVTFALPHALLGEEVAAAIILREGQAADATALRQFAARHLAAFKVPRRFVFVDEIPKGPTGKLQRIGLAARLGL